LNDTKNVPKDVPKENTNELADRQRVILKIIEGDKTTTSQKIAQKISL
jgi:hypothetical protein